MDARRGAQKENTGASPGALGNQTVFGGVLSGEARASPRRVDPAKFDGSFRSRLRAVLVEGDRHFSGAGQLLKLLLRKRQFLHLFLGKLTPVYHSKAPFQILSPFSLRSALSRLASSRRRRYALFRCIQHRGCRLHPAQTNPHCLLWSRRRNRSKCLLSCQICLRPCCCPHLKILFCQNRKRRARRCERKYRAF